MQTQADGVTLNGGNSNSSSGSVPDVGPNTSDLPPADQEPGGATFGTVQTPSVQAYQQQNAPQAVIPAPNDPTLTGDAGQPGGTPITTTATGATASATTADTASGTGAAPSDTQSLIDLVAAAMSNAGASTSDSATPSLISTDQGTTAPVAASAPSSGLGVGLAVIGILVTVGIAVWHHFDKKKRESA